MRETEKEGARLSEDERRERVQLMWQPRRAMKT